MTAKTDTVCQSMFRKTANEEPEKKEKKQKRKKYNVEMISNESKMVTGTEVVVVSSTGIRCSTDLCY